MNRFTCLFSIIFLWVLICSTAVFCAETPATPTPYGIHEAAAKGDYNTVEALLNSDPKLIDSKNDKGATPLHCAVDTDQLWMVRLLMSKGAKVDAKKPDGVTPLHIAASLGRADIARLLLAWKADPNAKDNKGRTPVSLAKTNKRQELVDILTNTGYTKGFVVPILWQQRIRTITAGDMGVYKRTLYGPTTLVLNETRTISASTNHGRTIPEGIKTLDLNWTCDHPIGRIQVSEWNGQDSSGNCYTFGINKFGKGWDLVTSPSPMIDTPAILQNTTYWTYTQNLASGKLKAVTARVIGTEWLNTPAGKFETFKVQMDESNETGKRYSYTIWVSPYAGAVIIKSTAELENMVESSDMKVPAVLELQRLTLVGAPSPLKAN